MKHKGRNKNRQDTSAPTVSAGLYEAWLRYVFDRPTTTPSWRWNSDLEDYEATPEEFVGLVGHTFMRSGTDLISFSNTQLSEGLWYIFDPSFAHIGRVLQEETSPLDMRLWAAAQIKHLYRDCFARRCSRTLSHLDEPGGDALNLVCYMLWDVSPLISWHDVIRDVLRDALYIPHDACIESALHGLGHCTRDRETIQTIIAQFLLLTPDLSQKLRRYANAAAGGCVL